MSIHEKKTMETETIELGDLFPPLIDSIFAKIPIKSLTKLKLVSKSWCNFITRLRLSTPPITSLGLVIFLRQINRNPTLHQSIFIKLQDQTLGQNCTMHASVFHNFPNLVDSCKGLVLYAEQEDNSWVYHVSGPGFDQHISLPCAHSVARSTSANLVFDGLQYEKFRVLCCFLEEVDTILGTMNCHIFWSKMWVWKECKARILNSKLLLEDGFERGHCFGSKVYSNGRLYRIWSLCMLIYDNNKGLFKLIRLPNTKSRRTNLKLHLSQFLWESEGCVHLCDPTNEGFYIWAYNGDQEDDDYNGHSVEYSSPWQYKRLVNIEKFELLGFDLDVTLQARIECAWRRIRPCAFNEDLQVLYFELPPRIVVSYSFEAQRFAIVWCLGKPGENYCMFKVFPFLFNSVNLVAFRKFFVPSGH